MKNITDFEQLFLENFNELTEEVGISLQIAWILNHVVIHCELSGEDVIACLRIILIEYYIRQRRHLISPVTANRIVIVNFHPAGR